MVHLHEFSQSLKWHFGCPFKVVHEDGGCTVDNDGGCTVDNDVALLNAFIPAQ